MAWFSWFGNKTAAAVARPRLTRTQWPVALYAIGDIHGSRALLAALEERIAADAAALPPGPRWIVTLGDYVDRGLDSAGVLDRLLARPPDGFERIALAGNHEDLMLDFFERPFPEHQWLGLGGISTLQSYGIDPDAMLSGRLNRRQMGELLATYVPEQHLSLLRTMPAMLSLPGTVFVHAGLRPGVPLEAQSENDLLWIRPKEQEGLGADLPVVVHGHTPAKAPVLTPRRICLDTGAYATGILSAGRFTAQGLQHLLHTDPSEG